MKTYLTHYDITMSVANLKIRLRKEQPTGPILVYGVPRGGIPVVYMLAGQDEIKIATRPEEADFIIDDLIDSGGTRDRYVAKYNKPFFALYRKSPRLVEYWLVFPWEQGDTDTSADDIPTRLLQYIGEDPERGGLLETPKRFLKAWQHYTSGYDVDPASILKVFEDGAEKYDEMVLVKNIPVYSHCEHHLAPFFGVAHVGYIPSGSIVGLSKLSRLVDVFSRRLQVQERLTRQIADTLEKELNPQGVAVVIECRHMCMEARGIQQQGTSTITSAMLGCMQEPEARQEFLTLIKG